MRRIHLLGFESLISAPDRRSTRREFQNLLPRRVWDASTGPDEIVVHKNSFDPELACLHCIYPPTTREDSYFHHIAEQLVVSVERVKSNHLITAEEAERIRATFPNLQAEVASRPYESIFKDLCSAGQLKVQSGDQIVLTPFAFISALAGVLLYFEFVKSLRPNTFSSFAQHNYIKANPFYPPNPQARELRRASANCPCCQAPHLRATYEQIWRR